MTRRFSLLLTVFALLLVGAPATAAPPGVLPDPIVEAVLEGDFDGFHYEIHFLGTQGAEAAYPNAAVEIQVSDSSGQLGVCNFGEDTLSAPSALAIGPGQLSASFVGTVPFGTCLGLGDAMFDLEWDGTGKLSTYVLHSHSDEICHERGKSRAGTATGTVELSSGPSFNVSSDRSTTRITFIETRCLVPGRPVP